MISKLHALFYELISGPLRKFKKHLFISLPISLAVLAFLLRFERFGFALFLTFGYVAALIIMTIVLQLRLSAKMNDLHFQLSLHDNLLEKGYRVADFYSDGAAGNPSLLFLLFKCLQICKPEKILELGSGQTTKLLSCYYREHPATYILTLEQDERWVEFLLPYVTFAGKSHDFRPVMLKDQEFRCPGTGTKIKTRWFDDVDDLLAHKFNLVIVDGPTGTDSYSRSGILRYIPDILDDSFVIIFDDAERYGEGMTISLLKRQLSVFKNRYVDFEVNGIKRQYVFCSTDLQFLQYT